MKTGINTNLFDVSGRKLTRRTKSSLTQCHVFFCLRVKSWVLNQAIGKNPKMTFHLKWLDIEASFPSLLFNWSNQFLTYLIHDVVYVRASLNKYWKNSILERTKYSELSLMKQLLFFYQKRDAMHMYINNPLFTLPKSYFSSQIFWKFIVKFRSINV